MFEKLSNFFNKMTKPEVKELASKDAAKERLHLVLMQDRANVSVDFLELMKQEIIDVIKKYIVVDENAIDVRLTNQENEDGTTGAPSLYANIPILNIKNDVKAEKFKDGTLIFENGEEKASNTEATTKVEEKTEPVKEDIKEIANVEVIELGEPETPVNNENNENNEGNVVVEKPEETANEAVVETPAEEVELTPAEEPEENKESIFDNENSSTIEIELEAENVEPILDFVDDEEDEDDEDGEDVTFDDLLKKAEEEEATQNNTVKKEEFGQKINTKPIRSNKGSKHKKR